MENPEVREQFRREADQRQRKISDLLLGTEAEPLVQEHSSVFAEHRQALLANDYAKTTWEGTLDEREIVFVVYQRKKEFGIKGDPNGFCLCVYRDTGGVKFLTGESAGGSDDFQRIKKTAANPPADTSSAHLQFRLVADPNETGPADEFPDPQDPEGKQRLRVTKPVLLDKSALAGAVANQDANGAWQVFLTLTPVAAQQFAAITRDHIGKRLAIVFDGKQLSAPTIRAEISGGQAVISSRFTETEAKAIATALAPGEALPAPAALPAASSFAVPIERVINDMDEGHGSEALCLKSGTVLDLPADGHRGQAAFEQWKKTQTNQPDLLADFARNRWAMIPLGLTLADFPSAKRDEAQPSDVAPALTIGTALEKFGRPGQLFYLLPATPQWPLTFAFKTNGGTTGLLQITGATS